MTAGLAHGPAAAFGLGERGLLHALAGAGDEEPLPLTPYPLPLRDFRDWVAGNARAMQHGSDRGQALVAATDVLRSDP